MDQAEPISIVIQGNDRDNREYKTTKNAFAPPNRQREKLFNIQVNSPVDINQTTSPKDEDDSLQKKIEKNLFSRVNSQTIIAQAKQEISAKLSGIPLKCSLKSLGVHVKPPIHMQPTEIDHLHMFTIKKQVFHRKISTPLSARRADFDNSKF